METEQQQRQVEVRAPRGIPPRRRPQVLPFGEPLVTRWAHRYGKVTMPPTRDVIDLKPAAATTSDAFRVPGAGPAPHLFEPCLRFVFGPG
jgi:hypothetical protein